jgi:hypothetical protein
MSLVPDLLNDRAMTNPRTGLALLFLVIGCGEGGGAQPAVTFTSLNPPANIDAVSCYDVVSTDLTISSQCSACCTQHGFPAASQYDGHCLCGDRRDDGGDIACAAQNASPSASLALCTTCCDDAGFRGHEWSTSSDGPSTCVCQGRNDASVCAGALSAASPANACQICCLNNGYLGSGYSRGGGADECLCLEP